MPLASLCISREVTGVNRRAHDARARYFLQGDESKYHSTLMNSTCWFLMTALDESARVSRPRALGLNAVKDAVVPRRDVCTEFSNIIRFDGSVLKSLG